MQKRDLVRSLQTILIIRTKSVFVRTNLQYLIPARVAVPSLKNASVLSRPLF